MPTKLFRLIRPRACTGACAMNVFLVDAPTSETLFPGFSLVLCAHMFCQNEIELPRAFHEALCRAYYVQLCLLRSPACVQRKCLLASDPLNSNNEEKYFRSPACLHRVLL